MLYLCTRNQEGTTVPLKAKVLGALVQLVRIRACHARGQGFESPTHRTEEDNRKVVFFFLFIVIIPCGVSSIVFIRTVNFF